MYCIVMTNAPYSSPMQGENGRKPPNIRTLSLLPYQPFGAVAPLRVSRASFRVWVVGKLVALKMSASHSTSRAVIRWLASQPYRYVAVCFTQGFYTVALSGKPHRAAVSLAAGKPTLPNTLRCLRRLPLQRSKRLMQNPLWSANFYIILNN